MLRVVDNLTSAAGSLARQVSVNGYSNNAVLYTVPQGKTFTGFASTASPAGATAAPPTLNINGSTVWVGPNGQPLTLLAGAVVKAGGNNVSLIGIEQ